MSEWVKAESAVEWHKAGVPPPMELLRFHKPSGLCGAYIKIAEACTDAPWAYHEACFWTVVGVFFGRTVSVMVGPQSLYCNLFSCLVGPSTKARKSTCIRMAKQLATLLAVPVLPTEVTPERLWDILAERPRGVLVSEEFSGFLKLCKKKYGQGLIEMFLQLYDCPDAVSKQTKSQGEVIIEKPFVSVLSASTIPVLRLALCDTDMTGGFVPRFMLVGDKARRDPLERQPPLDHDALARVAIRITAQLPGREAEGLRTLDEDAWAAYTASGWALEYYSQRMLQGGFEAVTERLKSVMLKAAVLSSAIEGNRVVSAGDVYMGFSMVLKLLTTDTYQRIAAVELRRYEQILRVQDLIHSRKTITRTALLNALFPAVSASQLDEHIRTLVEMKSIQVMVKKQEHIGGPDPTVYDWIGRED